MSSLSNPDAYSGIVKGSGGGGSGNDFPVNITDPQEGQILTFDSVNEEWVNVDINDDSLYDIIIEVDALLYGETDETAPIVSGYTAIKGFSCNKSFDEVLVIYNNRDIDTPKIKIITENYPNIINFNYRISPVDDGNNQIIQFNFNISTFDNDSFYGILIGDYFYVSE